MYLSKLLYAFAKVITCISVVAKNVRYASGLLQATITAAGTKPPRPHLSGWPDLTRSVQIWRCFARNAYNWNDRPWPHLSRCHNCNFASKGLLGQCKMIGQHLKSAQVKSERGEFAAHSCGWSRDCRNPWRPVECRTMRTVTSTIGMVMSLIIN